MPLLHKTFNFEIKAVNDELGLIEAYGSVFNNVDEGDDVVRPGAFKRTIQNSKSRIKAGKATFLAPMLWQHDPDQPIGGWYDMVEDAYGLLCKGRIILATELGQRIYTLIKEKVLDQFSIGYDIPSGGASYTKEGYRELKELRLWEVSVVTFAMNTEALLTSVKSASGSTSFPLADRALAWDGSKAHNQIVEWAKKADGTVDAGKMKKVHFWYDPAEQDKITGYKMPFCYIENGSPVAIPRGIMACAGVMSGARGGADIDDAEGVKAKIAAYYKKMSEKFNDPSIKPPWEKRVDVLIARKDFSDHYTQEAVESWLYTELNDICRALKCSLIDAFMIGDQPQEDLVDTILQDSGDGKTGLLAALEKWVARGVELGASAAMQETLEAHGYSGSNVGANYFMSRENRMETKAGRAISADNAAKIQAHIDNVRDMSNKSLKAAAEHFKAMQEHHKSMNAAADDLATVLQGSEPAYGTDTGTPADGQGEGKSAPYPGTRADHSSNDTEPTAAELDAALSQLRKLTNSF